MATLPIRAVKLPSVASTFPNGKCPPNLLRSWDSYGPMLVVCAYGMQAFHLFARRFGWIIKSTGRGRTYEEQVTLFKKRYTRSVLSGRPFKLWDSNGDGVAERWYQLPGVAMAAVPGTSNHGKWAADDMALELDGDSGPEGVTMAFIDWAVQYAILFGFAWETASEPWHVHWISGNVLPSFAVQILGEHGIAINIPGIPPPPPPPSEPEDDVQALPDGALRAYDSRPSEQHYVDPPYNEVNANVFQVPLEAGQERRIFIGMERNAMVSVTAVGRGGPGFISLGPTQHQCKGSPTSWDDVDRIDSGACVPVRVHEGHIWIKSNVSSCDVAVDVYSRWD